MVQPSARDSIKQKLHSVFNGKSLVWFCEGLRPASYSTLALFVSVLFLSEVGTDFVKAQTTPRRISVEMAQQPEATSQDQNRAAAERAYAEAEQLFKQGTAESRRQAIKKYEEALRLWRVAGDRSKEASTLHGIGLVYYSLGEKQKTLEYYNQSLALRRSLKQTGGEAGILWAIAGVYSNLGEKQKALDYYNQALPLFRAVGERSFEAFTLSSIGSVYSSIGEKQKALDAFNQALAIQRAAKDRSGEAETLQTIGMLYLSSGESQKGLDALNQALPLIQGEENRAVKAQILYTIGSAYPSLGENQKALDALNQALPLYRAEENRNGEANTLLALGVAYNSLGDKQKALDFLKQALVAVRAIGNRDSEGEILNSMGIIYRQLGDNQQALNVYNQALPIQREAKNPTSEAFTLNNIAGIYQQLGENQKALDAYNQTLSLQRQVSNPGGEADTRGDIASVYRSLGAYQQSLDSYNQALSLYRRAGKLDEEGKTLENIAAVYRLLEDYQKALDFSNQALSMWRKQGDRLRQTATLSTIARIYESMGDNQQALNAANQILSLGREMSDRFSEATGLIVLGRVYRAKGDYQQSLDSFNQGLSLLRAVEFRRAEPPVLDNIGKTYDLSNQPQKAIEFYNQALSLWRSIGDRAAEAETLYSIAGAERKRGNLDEAKKQIEAVISIVESLRSKVASQELRNSYFASVQKYYQFYIDLLMQLHKQQPSKGYDALALHASERARARSLLEILTEANADIRQGVDPKLLEKERTLQQQLATREKRQIELLSGNHTQEQAAALEKEIEELLAQYREVQAQIRATSPRYAALTQPQPLTLAEIQQQVLDDDTLLLEYSLGEERSYLWAVTKTGITSYELPKRADIEGVAKGFYERTGGEKLPDNRGLGVAVRENSSDTTTKLSQMLLSPVASQLGSKRLLIVGDGVLQYVPFAALPAPDSLGNDNNPVPLIVKHEIVNLPSASTLAILRQEQKKRQPAAKTLAILADPVFSTGDERITTSGGANNPSLEKQATRSANPNDLNAIALTRAARESGIAFDRLPFTRTEADRILQLVPTAEQMQALDFAASRTLATSPQLSQYRIVHFATHGILDSKNPELSGVVLSLVDEKGMPENGFLRLHDIFNLNLPAELVVLSACQTGLGQEVKGEGLVGLTRGFMYAGAPRVLVSLWSVNDEATSELMTRFYKKMLQENLKPAAALRAAQIEMSQDSRWKAPFYWAAFTLQGEWR
jgi:CHAT domain-containing protein/tetratricopeptide (TPR) repeat protein